ncbi:CoA pyrophosphatase [Pseudonocardia xishanensis]|uniref:CoA pyrophosphatase n=1 Tax=Pseudonocardia xishanensis TaxID=630995 RepID=A0ABP8RFB2_9PSEU
MSEVLRPDAAPPFLEALLEGVSRATTGELSGHRMAPPPDATRRAAVLMLFAERGAGPEVLLVERASTLRNHAGQVAFPGGRLDPGDTGPVGAALREAEEETGLDPAGVVPLALLPELFIPPSGFVVTPVLAHWARPTPVRAVDKAETAQVLRVPLADLAEPAHRITTVHPSGHRGAAFLVAGVLVWGFTGGLLSALLDRGGWTRPWAEDRVLELGAAWAAARSGDTGQEASGT